MAKKLGDDSCQSNFDNDHQILVLSQLSHYYCNQVDSLFLTLDVNMTTDCQETLDEYRISANSFRAKYSFLNLALCVVTFGDSK